MNQSLDPVEWPPICFEGKRMPQSLIGISILIDRDLSERTGDWIWRLFHCKEVWKEGESGLCLASATEIVDHLLEHRADVAAEVRARLGSHGFDGDATVDEWLPALARIQSLAQSSKGVCRWMAGKPTKEAQESLRAFSSFLDREAPLEEKRRISRGRSQAPHVPDGLTCPGGMFHLQSRSRSPIEAKVR